MDDGFLSVLLYGGLAGSATLLGIYLVLRAESWIQRRTVYLISFAAGALIALTLLDIVPHAFELNEFGLHWALLSFIGFYALEKSVVVHAGHEEIMECDLDSEEHLRHSFGLVSFLGIGFHSLLDGVVIGAGFADSHITGVVTTIGVTLHEFPEGLSILSILLHAGFDRVRAQIYSAVVALVTPIGAIVGYLFLRGIGPEILGALLGVAAGSFLYIAASDLLPETQRQAKAYILPLVAGGALVMLIVTTILEH
jgi:ZIP family zinc transporter/zinc and cadmium transporter